MMMFFLWEILYKRSSPVYNLFWIIVIIVRSDVISVVAVGDKTLELQSEWREFKTQQGHYFFIFIIFFYICNYYFYKDFLFQFIS